MSDRNESVPRRTWQMIIETSLDRFGEFIKDSSWFGRENEAVNLFAHRFLPLEMGEDSPFFSLEQIGIEVAVSQVAPNPKPFGRKKLVRKELVLWNDGAHNPWHQSRPAPAAVIEWKVERASPFQGDVEWLCRFTERFPETIGYAAAARLRTGLCWVRVESGIIVGSST